MKFKSKIPVLVVSITMIIVIALAIGISKVTLKTGNDTLISDKTDTYKENESYQKEFGKEPIILIFDDETLFSNDTLRLMNKLQKDIESLNGVYAINSPVTIINQISNKIYIETEQGLGDISDNLILMSNMLNANDPSNMPDFNQLNNAMQQLINAQTMLGQGLTGIFDAVGMLNTLTGSINTNLVELENLIAADPTKVQELQLINQIKNQLAQVMSGLTNIENNNQLAEIPTQTVQGLTNILTNLQALAVQMGETQNNLANLSQGLLTIGQNLKMIQGNFNAFEPSFPKKNETLEMMIFENGNIRENFNGFVVGENKLRMVIVLDSEIKDTEVDIIRDTLLKRLDEEKITEGVLISGKPILDRAVKSSMMDSMVLMMGSAVIIMILILTIFYKIKMRLLPMAMMGLVVVATIGLMGWIGVGMTMVSMAVFPILIGLGIDYFIQFQTRYEEERAKI